MSWRTLRSSMVGCAVAQSLVLAVSAGAAYAQQSSDDEPVEGAEAPSADSDRAEPQPAEDDSTALAVASGGSSARIQVLGGGGIGTRSLRRPTLKGSQRLGDALFPAVDVGLRLLLWSEQSVSLSFSVRYQTSVGLKLQDNPPFAPGNRISVRSERVEVAAGPGLRLGDSPRALVLTLPVGFQMRTLWPAVHDLGVVGYSLLGPFARAELSVALGDSLVLRGGPELQWIAGVDRAIEAEGASAQGLAFGAELTLKVPLGRKLALELSYRQANAIVHGKVGQSDLLDIERFATARLSGTL